MYGDLPFTGIGAAVLTVTALVIAGVGVLLTSIGTIIRRIRKK